MKIKGSELLMFMETGWPAGDDGDWFWDTDAFDCEPDPSVTYDTDEIGGIYYQGRGEDPTGGEGYDLAALIKRWRKSRSHDLLEVTVPKAVTATVKKALAAYAGVKVKDVR